MNLAKLFDALNISLKLSTPNEIKWACELIQAVQSMTDGQKTTLRAAFENGPLFDGDLPHSSCRDELIESGHMAKVIVKGQEGYNACTYKGSWAYKLIQAGC